MAKSKKNTLAKKSSTPLDLTDKTTLRVLDVMRKSLLIEIGIELKNTTFLRQDLSADSLDVVELAMDMEDEFGISIPDEAVEKLMTVGDYVAFVKEKLQ